MRVWRSLAKEVSERLEAGRLRDDVKEWAYHQLGSSFSEDAALWWCHGLAGLWLLALGDSELFPDLELRFSSVLESTLAQMRDQNRKTKDLQECSLWLQAQLLHFFWMGSSSEQEITELESLGALILELAQSEESHFGFFSELAFPPSFVAQDWSSFQESRLQILSDNRNPPASPLRRKKMKLSQVLARRWSASILDSDRRVS